MTESTSKNPSNAQIFTHAVVVGVVVMAIVFVGLLFLEWRDAKSHQREIAVPYYDRLGALIELQR